MVKSHKASIAQLGADITEQEALYEHYIHRSNVCGKKQEAVDHQSTDRSQIEVRAVVLRACAPACLHTLRRSDRMAGAKTAKFWIVRTNAQVMTAPRTRAYAS